MEIKTVAIIGLGALGILYGHQIVKKLPKDQLRIVADRGRIDRYERDGVYCNGEKCAFNYVTPETECSPADLVLFAVKYNQLEKAIPLVRNQVGENTVIISLLNGITSEEIIGQTYGREKMLYCVCQGMDALKEGNRLTYDNRGLLCFSEGDGTLSQRVKDVADFWESMGIPYEIDADMQKRLWGKFMLNVGVNQTVAVYEGTFRTIQQEGAARDTMIAAMMEVVALAEKEGISITREDVDNWLKILVNLNPEGMPSMRQDTKARRYSEVEMFAGAAIRLGRKHGVPTPVNQMLYDRIKKMESQY